MTEETTTGEVPKKDDNSAIWVRGFFMILLAIMFGVAQTVLGIAAILQFGWMLIAKERNAPIAAFGKDLASWMAKVALFQTGSTEDKPFPWTKWG